MNSKSLIHCRVLNSVIFHPRQVVRAQKSLFLLYLRKVFFISWIALRFRQIFLVPKVSSCFISSISMSWSLLRRMHALQTHVTDFWALFSFFFLVELNRSLILCNSVVVLYFSRLNSLDTFLLLLLLIFASRLACRYSAPKKLSFNSNCGFYYTYKSNLLGTTRSTPRAGNFGFSLWRWLCRSLLWDFYLVTSQFDPNPLSESFHFN